ncbi:hydroxymethylglutaryl-coenzyme A reductase-domain-containing protein [Diaporthe sp. PMI_573]|nr:hydroxymethylglutaryl-coenzyme A reductase-domain-containing protein [Diaporthaceae sp. PMI_573]
MYSTSSGTLTISDSQCFGVPALRPVFKCTTDRLHLIQKIAKDGGIRSGQFGSNINTANILAAMFIATGQDAGSVAEASWSHLTSELDDETKDLRMTLYFPSLPVGTVDGGTGYATQKEALQLVKCAAPGMKGQGPQPPHETHHPLPPWVTHPTAHPPTRTLKSLSSTPPHPTEGSPTVGFGGWWV